MIYIYSSLGQEQIKLFLFRIIGQKYFQNSALSQFDGVASGGVEFLCQFPTFTLSFDAECNSLS